MIYRKPNLQTYNLLFIKERFLRRCRKRSWILKTQKGVSLRLLNLNPAILLNADVLEYICFFSYTPE